MYDIEISRAGLMDWIGPHYFIPTWNDQLIYACVLNLTNDPQIASDICDWSETASPGAKYKGNKILARIRRQHP